MSDNIAADWLIDPGNKSFYGELKRGNELLYPGFEEQVAKEQQAIETSMTRAEGKNMHAYVDEVNTELHALTTVGNFSTWHVPPPVCHAHHAC